MFETKNDIEAEKDEKDEKEEKEKIDEKSEVKHSIDDFGVINNAFNFPSSIQYLTIIGSVEGHTVLPPQNKTTKYENIIPQLVAVEENKNIKGLLTILNTVGGDVEAGLAIAELISTLSKPTVSLVLGGGHSIGIPLATASDYSFVAESATMTLHPIRMAGLIIGAEQTYEYFRKMQERIIDFIVRTSHSEREIVTRLMNATDDMPNDVGTILYGKDAVEIGLMDEVGGLNMALAKLKSMIDEKEKEQKK
ncbi:ClpP family protease [Anaerovorax sp. IOR16]|uniref:ClpP family protease n=1 Tax=Anaerovorax sp. IOR16 TaxID=2773458 RepID=UPI0019D201E5|nr:ATP-dependent Clp protease proteolytic subunit [Anaerovorax sp. IOR16]